MVLLTRGPRALSGYPPCDPHENRARRRRDPIFGVKVRNANTVVEVVVQQHMIRAPGIMDRGMGGAQLVNCRIRRIPMAQALNLMRVEVATEAMMAEVGMEDM